MGFNPNRKAKAKPVQLNQGMRKKRAKQIRLTKVPEELKFFDTAVSFLVDTTLEVPATGQWALIPQGDTQSTRDGRQAVIKSVHFRGIIAGTSTSLQSVVNFWVVQDKQANGAAAAVADVFTSTVGISAMHNLNNNKRFKILHKGVVAPQTVGAAQTATGQNWAWPIEFFIPCNILMDWDSTTGAITEIRSNNIFLIAGQSVSDDELTMSGTARLRFIG